MSTSAPTPAAYAISDNSHQRVVIVGNPETVHVGHHLLWAGQQMKLDVTLIDIRNATQGSFLVRQVNRRLRGRRPARLNGFSQRVLETCLDLQPASVIVTGISPPQAHVLESLARNGIRCVNYLTDDPWNPAHRAKWFFDALPYYARIYTPRMSNLEDLAALGCRAEYLPFAYSPEIHFPEAPPSERAAEFTCDVLFYGGADRDRVPYIEALIDAGLNVHLYGGYWDRYASTRRKYRGMASPQILRWAVSQARLTLCLVRRANRDGHTMRTFEVPAMGGRMLVEDTEEHRALLGQTDDRIHYFSNLREMRSRAIQLVSDSAYPSDQQLTPLPLPSLLGSTYADRLGRMLSSQRANF